MTQVSPLAVLLMEAGESGIGGSFLSLSHLIRGLVAQGHQVHLISWNNSPYVELYKQLGAKVLIIEHPFYSKKNQKINKHHYFYNKITALSIRGFPWIAPYMELLLQKRCYNKIVEYTKLHKINVIHANNQPVRNFIAFWVAKKLQIPIICHIRSLNSYGLTRAHVHFISQLRCKMVAVSPSVKKHWHKMGIPENWIETVCNPYTGDYLEISPQKIVAKKLVCLGRLAPGKGLLFLLKTFAQLASKNLGFTLSLIGEGPLRNELEQYCLRAGIKDQVTFLGYVHEGKKLLTEFDMLIFPSEQEGLPHVILEAMAMKLPVIATRASGVVDIIEHNHNGLLVDNGDCEQLEEAILKLSKDQLLREQLTTNALQTVINQFNKDRYYQQIYDVYAKI